MLTLGDLFENVAVQGNVRISTWEDDHETVLKWFDEVEYVPAHHRSLERWLDAEVLYMFAPGDGFLHIEIEKH